MTITAEKAITISTVSGTAISTSTGWIPLDIHVTPFNVGFGVVKTGSGDVTFRVEHTFDNVFDPNVTPVAFTHDSVTAGNANVDGNYAFGVRAVRLTLVSASASSKTTLKVIQVGLPQS